MRRPAATGPESHAPPWSDADAGRACARLTSCGKPEIPFDRPALLSFPPQYRGLPHPDEELYGSIQPQGCGAEGKWYDLCFSMRRHCCPETDPFWKCCGKTRASPCKERLILIGHKATMTYSALASGAWRRDVPGARSKKRLTNFVGARTAHVVILADSRVPQGIL